MQIETADNTASTDDPAGFFTPRWYACYTRARHEKQVEMLLQRRGVESYLPVVSQVREWTDRRKRVELPLFPSYVFGRFALSQTHHVLTTPGVSTIVRAQGKPVPIGESELENVRRFAEAIALTGKAPVPRPFVEKGQWVTVVDGPFSGVNGVVIEVRGRTRVLIGLQAIGQGLEIDVDVNSLRGIPGPGES